MPGGQILSFGPYRLDTERVQLWCETQAVRLTPKAFQVLCYVVERPGQLVTKEELFQVVWADTVVSDAALTTCIQEIRKALQDNSRSPQYLETVHRRGFRFIAAITTTSSVQNSTFKVQEEEGASSQYSVVSSQQEESQKANGENGLESSVQNLEAENDDSSSQVVQTLDARPQTLDNSPSQTLHTSVSPASSRFTRGFILAAVLLLTVTFLTVQYLSLPTSSTQHLTPDTQPALPLPDKPSLIVLPFVNLSGDPEQEYFSDGLTEVLTGDLSKISGLFVIARNSAFTYKGKAVKVQDVSKEMGVRYVLEGSVQKADQRMRITTQLIDATSGYQLWSEQYDRPLQDIFALQDEIVQKIVTTLRLQLTLEEHGVIVRKHTDNLEAYDAYLRGVEYFGRSTKEANAQARQMWEKAVALDPQYAEAYVLLGGTYLMEWIWRWSANPQSLERALALAQQALALDDSLPGAHSLLSWVYAQQQQSDQAIAERERAIALDPNFADSYAGQAEELNRAGQPEEALRAVAQAMRLNPRYPPWYLVELGWAYELTGRYAEAIATQKEAISRNPNLIPAHLHLAVSYLWQWRTQQSPAAQTLEPAVAAGQRALALNDSLYWTYMLLGIISLYQQQYDQALAEVERGVALAPTEAVSYADLAVVLSCVGRTEDALEAAAQALRLKPFIADTPLAGVGTAYALAGRYEEARAPLQRYLSRYPNMLHIHLMLAAVYSELGQAAEAQTEAAEVLRLNPKFSLEVHRQRMPIKDPAVLERHLAALRKAGLK
jgi:TolB-like protein/DNA-binding winged helix-turn-helix (wHTH) protein/Tfp pilus assembly protein PilF